MNSTPLKRIASFVFGVALIVMGSTALAQAQPSDNVVIYWKEVASAAGALLVIVLGSFWATLAVLWKQFNRVLDLRLEALARELALVNHKVKGYKAVVDTITQNYVDREESIKAEFHQIDLEIQRVNFKLGTCKHHHQFNGATQ